MSDMFTSPKRPFFRSTDKLTLEVLPEQTYYQFAHKWFQSINTKFPEDVFHTIYSMVSGYTGYIQKVLNRLYELQPNEVTDELVKESIDFIIKREEDDFRRLYALLTNNQAQVLKAIAKEQIVASPTSQAFIKKYNLPAASSVKRAIDFLNDYEYIYPTKDGYIVYERFMAIWLQRM